MKIVNVTFSLLSNHTDGWHDDIFSDGTIINYLIGDAICDEGAAARAYRDIRNKGDGIVHGVTDDPNKNSRVMLLVADPSEA